MLKLHFSLLKGTRDVGNLRPVLGVEKHEDEVFYAVVLFQVSYVG